MEIYLLLLVFIVMIFVLFILKKPLFIAVSAGIIASIILFRIPIDTSLSIVSSSIIAKSTINVLLILYVVTLLQRMMQKEGALSETQLALEKIFNNRRINAFVAPTFMGLLPSASAIYMAGEMVETTCHEDLSSEDKTFVASYFRHVFEGFLPTYSSVIILISLSKTDINAFVIGMLPVIVVYIALGYFFFLRKLDNHHSLIKYDKGKQFIKAIIAISPVIAVLVLIMAFDVEVQYATIAIIIVYALYQRYSFNQLLSFIKDAFEPKVLFATLIIFIFKDIILSTNVMEMLPVLFAQLNMPAFLIYGLIFFVSSLLLGNSATYVIFIPLALVAIPDAGASLFIYLNSISFIAMQIAPTHICLFLACEYFKTEMTSLIKRTIPIVLIFMVIITIYYLFISNFI